MEEAGQVPEAPSRPATLSQGQERALLTLATPRCCAADPLSMVHIMWHNSDDLENLQMDRCCQWCLWPVHPWQDGIWMDSPVFETKRVHSAWYHRAREWNGDTRRWCNSCGKYFASFLSTPALMFCEWQDFLRLPAAGGSAADCTLAMEQAQANLEKTCPRLSMWAGWPLRNCRLGEALHPGPDEVLRRLRRKTSLSALSTSSFAEQLDAGPSREMDEGALQVQGEVREEAIPPVDPAPEALALMAPAAPTPLMATAQKLVLSEEFAKALLECPAAMLLEMDILPQRSLPNSVLDLVIEILVQLWSMADDASLSTQVRWASRTLAFLAPRWLWPEPPRVGRSLAPRSRPNLIKQRAAWLQCGRWEDMLQALIPVKEVAVGAVAAVRHPGMLDEKAVQQLMNKARRGQAAKGWKQLWSWGVPNPSAEVATELSRKLGAGRARPSGHPLGTLRVAAPALVPRFTDAVWDKTLSSFHEGKAVDSLGWSQECFLTCARHPRAQPLVKQLVHQLLCGDMDNVSQSLLITSKVIALRKDRSGNLRPVSLPTVWRKCAASLTVHAFREDMKHDIGEEQYGCGRANGVASLATTLTSTTQLHPEWCHLQVDVQDAFSAMDRDALWNKLQALSLELALSQWHWLMGAPTLLLPCAVKMRSLAIFRSRDSTRRSAQLMDV